MGRAILIALLGLLFAAPAAALPAQHRAAAPDWSQIASRTPEGGFRVGNPAAPVKLIEYYSTTCPHCAALDREGGVALAAQIRSGRVSLEYRNYVLNGLDLAASFISRCATPRQYIAMTHDLLATQDQWMGRYEALGAEQRSALAALPTIQAMQRIVPLAGLDAIATRHGLGPAQQRACLADQAALTAIGTMRQAAHDLGVNSTPSFLINGRPIGPQDWASLAPQIGVR